LSSGDKPISRSLAGRSLIHSNEQFKLAAIVDEVRFPLLPSGPASAAECCMVVPRAVEEGVVGRVHRLLPVVLMVGLRRGTHPIVFIAPLRFRLRIVGGSDHFGSLRGSPPFTRVNCPNHVSLPPHQEAMLPSSSCLSSSSLPHQNDVSVHSVGLQVVERHRCQVP
jgi:hypothetical protein